MSRELYKDLFNSAPPKETGTSADGNEKELSLYTSVRRVGDKIKVRQEVNDKRIPGTLCAAGKGVFWCAMKSGT